MTRAVVHFIYCDNTACNFRTNTRVPLTMRKEQGWITFLSDGQYFDYCPEHHPVEEEKK